MTQALIDTLLKLRPEERLAVIDALWASMKSEDVTSTIPGWHRDLLDERLRDDENDHEPVETWEMLRRRLEASSR
jgi:putative addiction module component (TIGR02574 family)